MIEIGKIQVLSVIRKATIGVYLNVAGAEDKNDILLPQSQVPEGTEIGDEIEVFVYRDSKDRLIATVRKPKLVIGELAPLKVVEINDIGAFLDWGLERDLFLPFKEQDGFVRQDGTYLVGLYADKSNRLCATMKISGYLKSESPYKEDDKVTGIVYRINEEIGAFVAVENKYHGLVQNKEIFTKIQEGDIIEARVKSIRPDGKLELSLRDKSYNEIDNDAKKIMERLENEKGLLKLNDDSSPEKIKSELGMSKKAFKRAIGRLLKEGAIEFVEGGIKLRW